MKEIRKIRRNLFVMFLIMTIIIIFSVLFLYFVSFTKSSNLNQTEKTVLLVILLSLPVIILLSFRVYQILSFKRFQAMVALQENYPSEFDEAVASCADFTAKSHIPRIAFCTFAGDWFIQANEYAIKREYVESYQAVPASTYKGRTTYSIVTKNIELKKKITFLANEDSPFLHKLDNWIAGKPLDAPSDTEKKS